MNNSRIDLNAYYEKHYVSIINSGAVGMVSKLVHWSLESFPYSMSRKRFTEREVLEVGAGHGQHLAYVKDIYQTYTLTDLRPDNIPKILKSDKVTIHDDSVDAHRLPFEDGSFDRVIATCLIIHLSDPEKALKEWFRVLKIGGRMTIYVPCETGAVLRIAQQMSTRRKQKKLGIDADYLHRIEHPYSYLYIKSVALHMFRKNLRIRKFPFVVGSWNFNLWSVFTVEKNN
jgi:ubiquinone/menaquinone biosynthesis C-methylase UbiE